MFQTKDNNIWRPCFWHTSLPHQTAIFGRNKCKSWPYKVETVVLIYVNYAGSASKSNQNKRAGGRNGGTHGIETSLDDIFL